MGQGVGRVWRPPAPRVERALPFSDEFWCFGPDKGPSIVFGQATRAAGAAAARVVEGVFCGARHAPSSNLTHARAFATHRCGVDGCARGSRERGCLLGVCRVSRRDDDGAGDGGSEAVDVWSWRASTAAASWARRPAVGEKRAGVELWTA